MQFSNGLSNPVVCVLHPLPLSEHVDRYRVTGSMARTSSFRYNIRLDLVYYHCHHFQSRIQPIPRARLLRRSHECATAVLRSTNMCLRRYSG